MSRSHDPRHAGPGGATAPGPAAGRGARTGRGAHRSLTSELTGRVEALEAALAAGGDRVSPDVRAEAGRTVAAVRDRLGRGVDHTLVALVGGTGSGKSSLFNALCGLPLADVDVRRPTTSEPTACVWGGSGQALLDWLGVAPGRRFQRETALDGDAQADLRGLVLLDLPDHDSVAASHREVVDRLLPMVDLLVWVVDPQKYADDALHSGYLRGLVGQEAAMVVVLNQVDTVPTEVRDRLLADVARLLAEDGLVGVPVLATAVPDGTGIADLRAALAAVVARPGVAAVRAGAEIAVAGRALAADVAPADGPSTAPPGGPGGPAGGPTVVGPAGGAPSRDALPTGPVVDALVAAAGLPAIADAVEAAVRGRAGTVPPAAPVQAHGVGLARHRWLADVGRGLPGAWQRSLDGALPGVGDIAGAVGAALAGVTVAARRSRAATVLTVAAVVSVLAAVVVGGALLAGRFGLDVPDAADAAVTPWLAGSLLVLALALWAVARLVRHRAARRSAAAVRREGRAAVEGVVTGRLVEPTLAVLSEHRHVHELAVTAAATEGALAAADDQRSPAATTGPAGGTASTA